MELNPFVTAFVQPLGFHPYPPEASIRWSLCPPASPPVLHKHPTPHSLCWECSTSAPGQDEPFSCYRFPYASSSALHPCWDPMKWYTETAVPGKPRPGLAMCAQTTNSHLCSPDRALAVFESFLNGMLYSSEFSDACNGNRHWLL